MLIQCNKPPKIILRTFNFLCMYGVNRLLPIFFRCKHDDKIINDSAAGTVLRLPSDLQLLPLMSHQTVTPPRAKQAELRCSGDKTRLLRYTALLHVQSR